MPSAQLFDQRAGKLLQRLQQPKLYSSVPMPQQKDVNQRGRVERTQNSIHTVSFSRETMHTGQGETMHTGGCNHTPWASP